MARFRIDQINEQVLQTLADILRTVKDPRVSGLFVSLTGADVAKDFSVAKIYYSVLEGHGKSGAENNGNTENDKIENDLKEGLKSAGGYIRRELASRLNLRVTPKLAFIKDDSAKKALNIAGILKDIGLGGSLDGDNENNNNNENIDKNENDKNIN
ncbi:MAG: 30S ribosome-binding factor RbfA [Eubacteriales bacterium]